VELRIVPADGGSAITLVDSSADWMRGDVSPSSISQDGSVLVVTNNNLGSGDIWAVPLSDSPTASLGDADPREFLATMYDERGAVFSPNSRFVAYVSDESGGDEVYVVPYPGPGAKSQVSRGGGRLPQWSADGRELFYMNGDEMMVTAVETSGVFRALAPRALFPFPQIVSNRGFPYSVAADGARFLMLKSNVVGGGERPVELRIVVNWAAEIEPLAPSR
jgi:serine/threonine-protein kinase